jgi:hypothetical protein
MRTGGVTDIRSGSQLPSFAGSPSDGALYVTWTDSSLRSPSEAVLISSRDAGGVWSPPTRIEGGFTPARTFTPSVATDDRGDVAVSYYRIGDGPDAFHVNEYLRVSEDGGLTFQTPIRVTPRGFDIRFAAQSGGYFLGDYAGLAGTNERFHLVWIDTHLASGVTGRMQPDVFTAHTQ